MPKEKNISILTKNRSWPWFVPGTSLVLAGVFLALQAMQPSFSPDDFRISSALTAAEFKVQQAAALSNKIEQARRAYDSSHDSDSTAADTLLAMWSIESSLNQMSDGSNNVPPLESPRVTSMAASERQQQAKRCRAKLDQVAIKVAQILGGQQGNLEEFQRQKGASIARQHLAQNLRLVMSGATVCAGIAALFLAYRNRQRT